jgi:hypothetical protein
MNFDNNTSNSLFNSQYVNIRKPSPFKNSNTNYNFLINEKEWKKYIQTMTSDDMMETAFRDENIYLIDNLRYLFLFKFGNRDEIIYQ